MRLEKRSQHRWIYLLEITARQVFPSSSRTSSELEGGLELVHAARDV